MLKRPRQWDQVFLSASLVRGIGCYAVATLPPPACVFSADKNDYPLPKKLLCKCTAWPRLSVTGIPSIPFDRKKRSVDGRPVAYSSRMDSIDTELPESYRWTSTMWAINKLCSRFAGTPRGGIRPQISDLDSGGWLRGCGVPLPLKSLSRYAH